MLRNIVLIAVVAVTILFPASVQASKVRACGASGTIIDGDYSDAKGLAKSACHHTSWWQTLGTMTSAEKRREESRKRGFISNKFRGTGSLNDADGGVFSYRKSQAYKNNSPDIVRNGNNFRWTGHGNTEQAVKDVDGSDDGVMWRTKNEDGSWSDWGTSGTMYRGQEVEFKFAMWRANIGHHTYDKLKAWVNWNGDHYFNNGGSGNEVIFDRNWYKNHDIHDRRDTTSGVWNGGLKSNNSSDLYREYKITLRVPMDAKIGDIWMRARVTCSDSLASYSDNFNLLPWGYQHQGEVEDYKLTIASRAPDVPVDPDPPRPGRPGPVASVPEPETYALFSILLGLMALNRRRKQTLVSK